MRLDNFVGVLKEARDYYLHVDGSYVRTDLVFEADERIVILKADLEHKSEYVRTYFLNKKVKIKLYDDGFWNNHIPRFEDLILVD